MSQYRTGKITVVNGSASIEGEETAFLSNIAVGDTFKVAGIPTIYEVASIGSNTLITLTSTWAGDTLANVDYQIGRDRTPNLNLTEISAQDRDWTTHLTSTIRRIDSLLSGGVTITATPEISSIKLLNLTSGRIPIAGSGGLLEDSINLYYNTNTYNFGMGTNSFGTSAAKVFGFGTGTAPTTSPADVAQLWAADLNSTPGKHRLHERTESGNSSSLALKTEVDDADNSRAKVQGLYFYPGTVTDKCYIADSTALAFGTNNLTFRAKLSLPSWTPASSMNIISKGTSASDGFTFRITASTGVLALRLGSATVYSSTVAVPATAYQTIEVAATVIRESASTAGTVYFYVNGKQLGDVVSITAGVPPTVTTSGIAYFMANYTGSPLYEGTLSYFTIYNRALSSTEIEHLYNSGIYYSDRYGSQTALTSGTLTIGKRYCIDTYNSDDNFTNIGAASNAAGVEFIATGTTPTHWAHSSSLRKIGAVLALMPEGIQPSGQWLDNSSNALHMVLSGANNSITNYLKTGELRQLLTWARTHEAQYIGANKNILPSDNIYITDMVGIISGTTITNIQVGDGSDANRWISLTTSLAAGTVGFTMTNRNHDGTNKKISVDPSANFTGSINWLIKYLII